MKKKVVIKLDENKEMAKIVVGDTTIQQGNFWDFNSFTLLADVLDELGINCIEENYDFDKED